MLKLEIHLNPDRMILCESVESLPFFPVAASGVPGWPDNQVPLSPHVFAGTVHPYCEFFGTQTFQWVPLKLLIIIFLIKYHYLKFILHISLI